MAAIRFIDRHEPAEGEVTALVHNIARAIRLPHADDDGLLTEHLAAFFVLNGRDPEGHFTNRDQMREYWKWNRERVLGAWTSSGCSGVPWAATALDDSFVVTPDDIEVLATHYYSEIGANNPASLKYAGAKLEFDQIHHRRPRFTCHLTPRKREMARRARQTGRRGMRRVKPCRF